MGLHGLHDDELGAYAPPTNEMARFAISEAVIELKEGRIPINGSKPGKVTCKVCGNEVSPSRVEAFVKEGTIPKRCMSCQAAVEQKNHRQRIQRRRNLRLFVH